METVKKASVDSYPLLPENPPKFSQTTTCREKTPTNKNENIRSAQCSAGLQNKIAGKYLRAVKYSFDLESVALDQATLAQADCIIIATNHDKFDYDMNGQYGKLVIDT